MCKEEPLFYNTSTQQYNSAQKIQLDRFCNGITIRNGGASNLLFDDEVIGPGQSKMIGGNRKEIIIGRHDIAFAGAGVNLCYVTQKFYIKLEDIDPHMFDNL